MKKTKRLSSFLITLAILLTFLPSININAYAASDVKIISTTNVTAKDAKAWAKSKGATDTFISLADLYFKYAKDCGGVNPAGAYVQAAIETGYGKFGGVIDESYKNPCGMKNGSGGGDTDKEAHHRFASWDEGVQAHLDHLALYAGASGYPRSNTPDPRHFVTIKGNATTFGVLGGKWASDASYGDNIIRLYNELTKSSGADEDDNKDKQDDTSNKDTQNDKSDTSSNDDSSKSEDEEKDNSKPIDLTDTEMPDGPTASTQEVIYTDYNVYTSSSIGWRYQYGNWYYYNSDGTLATGWIKPDNNWYYLYSDGQMATGWSFLDGVWYYFNPSGDMKTGWLLKNGSWYFMQNSGAMVTGYQNINGQTYYLTESGAMKTGWLLDNNQWLYFDSDGAMLKGWIRPNGTYWYYLHNNGVMATGLLKVNQKAYYLYSTGEMAEGWIDFGNGDYHYFMPSAGNMALSTVVDGWQVGADGSRIKQVETPVVPSNSKVIVIDPGHNYGGDDGAYATSNGVTYCERDLNMQVALKLRNELQSRGYKVILTRQESDHSTTNLNSSLYNRAKIANDANADLFISIHHNSADITNAYGIETFYSDRVHDAAFGGGYDSYRVTRSKQIATAINNQLVSALGSYNRGAKESNLYVTRNTNMPSVLVEVGFITNPSEAARCADSYSQSVAAKAIADAISAQI